VAAAPLAWLFPGQNPINPMAERQINRAKQAAAKAETKALYARVAVSTIRDVESPLEWLGLTLPGDRRDRDSQRRPGRADYGVSSTFPMFLRS
jgi:hypothetical protein